MERTGALDEELTRLTTYLMYGVRCAVFPTPLAWQLPPAVTRHTGTYQSIRFSPPPAPYLTHSLILTHTASRTARPHQRLPRQQWPTQHYIASHDAPNHAPPLAPVSGGQVSLLPSPRMQRTRAPGQGAFRWLLLNCCLLAQGAFPSCRTHVAVGGAAAVSSACVYVPV